MYSSKDFALDQEYRQRQERQANRRRTIDQLPSKEKGYHSTTFLPANKLSVISIVVSIAILALFFLGLAGSSQAQELIEPGGGADTLERAASIDLIIGVVHLENENFVDSEVAINRAIETFPELAAAYTLRSALYTYTEEYDLAIADALYALALDEDEVSAYYFVAEAYFANGTYMDARHHFEAYLSALKSSPSYKNALVTRLVGNEYKTHVLAQIEACNTYEVAMNS